MRRPVRPSLPSQDGVVASIRSRNHSRSRENQRTIPQFEPLEPRVALSATPSPALRPVAFAVPDSIVSEGRTAIATVTLLERDSRVRGDIGWFAVDDASGRIGSLRPGDPGYFRAALSSARRKPLFSRDDPDGSQREFALPSGSHFGVYFLRNATFSQWSRSLADGSGSKFLPRLFLSIATANPGRFQRVHTLAPATFGLETGKRGGDRDFNDAILRLDFRFATSSAPDPPPPSPPDPSTPPAEDSTPPTVRLLTVEPPSSSSGGLVRGQASDLQSGPRTVRVQLGDGPPTDLALDPQGRFELPILLDDDASILARFQAIDRAGNASGVLSIKLTARP